MIINGVQRQDDGLYECQARNEGGQFFKSGHIQVCTFSWNTRFWHFFCSLKFLNKCSVVENSAYFLSMCNSKRHTDFDIRYHEGIFFTEKVLVMGPRHLSWIFNYFSIFPKTLALLSIISSTTVAEQLAKYIYNCFCSNLLLLGFVFGVCVLFWFLHRTTCYSQLARKIFCSYFMYFLTTTKMVLVNVCFS